jgi:hypothetical protein
MALFLSSVQFGQRALEYAAGLRLDEPFERDAPAPPAAIAR